MSVIQDRPSVAPVATTTTSNVDNALQLGAKVIAELATQPPATTMNVPSSMLQDLAAAVVMLAAELKKTQGVPVTMPKSAPRVDAHIKIVSGFQGSGVAHEDLKSIASAVREKCAELGIRLNVELGSEYGAWHLKISGQAPKDDLDKVKQFAGDLARKNSMLASGSAKVEVLKYDVL